MVDAFTYEPTTDEQLERERDKKKNPVLFPYGFSRRLVAPALDLDLESGAVEGSAVSDGMCHGDLL